MRSMIVGVALALAACGGKATGEARPPLPAGTVELTEQQVRTAQVEVDTTRLEDVALMLRVPATLAPPEFLSATVGSIVEGRVTEVFVIPGDRVKAGQPLVKIHTHELATAQRDLSQARAELEYAQAAYERAQRLLAAEAVSQEEVERRRAAYESARAEHARAEEIVHHLYPSADGDAQMLAPRAGTVFDVHVKAGEAVVPGDTLVELGDPSRLWATGFIPEQECSLCASVAPGARVAVRVDVLPDVTIDARLVRVGGFVDSLRRALDIRVELLRVPPGVRPGMYATIELPGSRRATRVVLPADAVQRMADGEVAFVQDAPGRYRAVPVRTTPLDGGRVAVEGLVAGLPVVVKGAYFVRAQFEGAPAEEGA